MGKMVDPKTGMTVDLPWIKDDASSPKNGNKTKDRGKTIDMDLNVPDNNKDSIETQFE